MMHGYDSPVMASPLCHRVPVITRTSTSGSRSGGRSWSAGGQEVKEQYSLDTLEESLTSGLLDSLSLTGEIQLMLREQEGLAEEQEFHQLSEVELRQLVEKVGVVDILFLFSFLALSPNVTAITHTLGW